MIELVAPATELPLTLDEIKTHTRVTITEDDGLLMDFQRAAVDGAEKYMRAQIMPTQFVYRPIRTDGRRMPYYTGESWHGCCPFVLEPGPVLTVDSVVLSDGSATDEWVLLQKSPFGLFQAQWPTAPHWGWGWGWNEAAEAPTITFTSGWPDAASVPGCIKAWILMRITSLYEDRNEWLEGRGAESPFFSHLLDPYRDFRF